MAHLHIELRDVRYARHVAHYNQNDKEHIWPHHVRSTICHCIPIWEVSSSWHHQDKQTLGATCFIIWRCCLHTSLPAFIASIHQFSLKNEYWWLMLHCFWGNKKLCVAHFMTSCYRIRCVTIFQCGDKDHQVNQPVSVWQHYAFLHTTVKSCNKRASQRGTSHESL